MNSSCEFDHCNVIYRHDIGQQYHSKHPIKLSILFFFCGQKDSPMPLTLRWVQYMVTSVLQNWQYVFCVRWSRKCWCGIIWQAAGSWCHFLHQAFTNSLICAINVLMNLDDMFKNKTLMFDIDRFYHWIYSSFFHRLQCYLTLGELHKKTVGKILRWLTTFCVHVTSQ